MTNNNIHANNNSLNNSVRTKKNKISLSMNSGVLTGNIINITSQEIVLIPECAADTLDFSCNDNSQYIPLI